MTEIQDSNKPSAAFILKINNAKNNILIMGPNSLKIKDDQNKEVLVISSDKGKIALIPYLDKYNATFVIDTIKELAENLYIKNIKIITERKDFKEPKPKAPPPKQQTQKVYNDELELILRLKPFKNLLRDNIQNLKKFVEQENDVFLSKLKPNIKLGEGTDIYVVFSGRRSDKSEIGPYQVGPYNKNKYLNSTEVIPLVNSVLSEFGCRPYESKDPSSFLKHKKSKEAATKSDVRNLKLPADFGDIISKLKKHNTNSLRILINCRKNSIIITPVIINSGKNLPEIDITTKNAGSITPQDAAALSELFNFSSVSKVSVSGITNRTK